MNRHKKIAIIIAPFLSIGGFIAADYYAEAQADKSREQSKVKALTLDSTCNLQSSPCLLQHELLSLTLELNNTNSRQLLAQSNTPLKGIKIAINSDKPVSLTMDTTTDWYIDTDASLRKPYQIKLIASDDNNIYYSDFRID